MTTDWNAWHSLYDDPESGLSRRLRVIQGLIGDWLDRTAPDDVRVVSACAGDGRDLLQVLRNRGDAKRVTATLLEYDEENVARARSAAAEFPAIAVRQVDAGRAESYDGAIPADLVLMAGVFGNISDEDVQATIEALPGMCEPGALVIWTRHRGAPDLTPAIRSWFTASGFIEESFFAPDDVEVGVGSHRYTGPPQPPPANSTLFTFTR
ncbi:class I SAM-dependent methyltransferase [Kribbella qitaiheensis]|uniref:Class I SAM-dependent methyltransferase n=1 Tax=Kribbella qitaiheensis TaxID=1544730 RepID=A0A7G6WYN5_9ACTN|nr:class I SAM-dependent methyltransferase [Kribbella qitaiheensis]QNE19100.1 class I SAM-dependent methyltransferase [Kribbella qitaiheensis]